MSPQCELSSANRLITLAGVVLELGLSFAFGATDSAPPPAVQFSVFALRPVPGLAFLPGDEQAPQPIELYPTARSSVVSYRGPMPVRLVNTITGTAVAEAWIPPTTTRALIVLAPANGQASGGSLTPFVVDEHAPQSVSARLTVLNLSGLSLRGRINGRQMAIRDGLNPIPGVSGAVHLELRAAPKDRDYHSYAEDVTLASGEQALLMLFTPYYRGSLEVQARLLREETPAISTGTATGPQSGGQKRDFGGARSRD